MTIPRSVPAKKAHPELDRTWIADVLLEFADLIRDHLPRRSKAYPVERLAREILELRDALLAGDPSS